MAFLSSREDNITTGLSPAGDEVTTGVTVNTDGSPVVLFASTSFDAAVIVFAIHITGAGGGQDSGTLLDILVDDVEVLADLNLGFGGPIEEWTVPLRIPAGSEVSVRARSAISALVLDVGAYLYGGSDNTWAPDSWVTYGSVPTASRGTLFTSGDGSEGSWTSLGTPAVDHPNVGFRTGGGSDGSLSSKFFYFDLGKGATPTLLIADSAMTTSGDPHTFLSPSFLPITFPVDSGEELFVRGQTTGSTNNQLDATAYGAVGGGQEAEPGGSTTLTLGAA